MKHTKPRCVSWVAYVVETIRHERRLDDINRRIKAARSVAEAERLVTAKYDEMRRFAKMKEHAYTGR